MKSQKTYWTLGVVLIAGALVLDGCSVYMAANKPGLKDTGILRVGTPRSEVISEFGVPQLSKTNADGLLEETWAYTQGQSLWWKIPRVIFYVAADVFTVGLFEVISTPAEMLMNKKQKTFTLVFDRENKIKDVQMM